MAGIAAVLGTSVGEVLIGGLKETVLQVLYLLCPFLLVGLILHGLERLVQRCLARHFGWGSILWTGWLGTPVHEMSHAALCLVFGHRIEEMALFKPDRQTGRMGYVNHSWNPANPYAVAGNFFIGIAPLVGGALVLFLFLWIFYPEAARGTVSETRLLNALSAGAFLPAGKAVLSIVTSVLGNVVTTSHLATWQFWLFLYLVLCVGSHLAPSPADYRGARRGALLLLVLLLGFNWAFLAFGGEPGWVTQACTRLLGPALALFVIALVLNSLVALLVFLFTGALDLLRVREGKS
jgi:hypothetical protein